MRKRTIARWRRAALGGAMGLLLAIPARAQKDTPPPPPPPLAPQPQDAAAQPQDQASQPQERAAQPQPQAGPRQRENAPITEHGPRPAPDANIKAVPGTPEEYTIQKGD